MQRSMGRSRDMPADVYRHISISLACPSILFQHAANSAGRIRHIASVARNEMDVNVHAVLSCRLADIDADVEAVRRVLLLDERLSLVEQVQHRALLFRGHVEEVSDVALRDDEQV